MIIEIACNTAWSPPQGVYKTMNKDFDIITDAVYEELGSEFFGRCFYENGEEVDNSYEIPSNLEELNELRIIIGPELDDYMGSTWEQLQEDWQELEIEKEEDEEEEFVDDSFRINQQ